MSPTEHLPHKTSSLRAETLDEDRGSLRGFRRRGTRAFVSRVAFLGRPPVPQPAPSRLLRVRLQRGIRGRFYTGFATPTRILPSFETDQVLVERDQDRVVEARPPVQQPEAPHVHA